MEQGELHLSPQEILDSLPHFVWGKDTHGRYIVANEAYARRCGVPLAGIIGKTDLDLFPKEIAEQHVLNESQVFRTKDHLVVEEEGEEREGVSVWYEVYLQTVLGDDGNVAGIVAEGHEITGRKRMKEEMSDVRERYDELIDNLMVGVYRNTPGPEGHFLEANPAMVQMFEAESKEEFMKHNVSDLYEDPAKRQEFSAKMMAQGYLKGEELELKTLKGRKFWGAVTATLKRDSAGEVYFDGIIEDITARKEAETKLKEKVGELERFNQFMVNRELKMSELKEEIEGLKRTVIKS